MIQGSNEWHAFRMKHVCSTDASTIWRGDDAALYALWEEKCGLVKRDFTSDAMERGKELEEVARNWFWNRMGIEMLPDVLEDPEHPFLSGSFDGLSLNKKIMLEIKCPTTYTILEKAQREQYDFDHWCQCQHLMKVSGLESAYYEIYYDESDVYVFEIPRNQVWIEEYVEKATAFWDCVEKKIPPMATISTPEFSALENQLVDVLLREGELKDELKLYEKLKEQIYEKMRRLSNEKSVRGDRIIFRKCRRAGNVDYKAIPELSGVDLEKYRKDEIVYWRAERKNG